MKISVVIPAFNEEKLLPRCLAAVSSASQAFTALDWENEVIVCDNNSSDETASLAEAAGARVVFEPINQIARARNRGASVARGDWLIFVDADSYPSRELFAKVAERLEDGQTIGGGATVLLENVSGSHWLLNHGWNWLSRGCGWMAGSFLFCERRAFEELGGFSPELFASEEIDFSERLKQLARREKRRVGIIARPSLLTSGRRAELCRARDYGRLLLTVLLSRGQSLKRKEDCSIWYDGKR